MSALAAPNFAVPPSNDLGALLRHWRSMRGQSQLSLSGDTGVSQRHISFIESGRSIPSRQTLLHLATALDVPLRERNTLLLAAGYAPIYSDNGLSSPEMRSVTAALERMLRQHEPFPAVVMDRYWNVLLANTAVARFFGHFVDLAARPGPRNLLHLMFDPAGMRPFLANWNELARSLLERVRRESVGRAADGETRKLVATLLAYPDVDAAWRATTISGVTPVIPIGFVKDGSVLNLFSMVTTVGTPQTIAAQELRVECMFPADEATELAYARLVSA